MTGRLGTDEILKRSKKSLKEKNNGEIRREKDTHMKEKNMMKKKVITSASPVKYMSMDAATADRIIPSDLAADRMEETILPVEG